MNSTTHCKICGMAFNDTTELNHHFNSVHIRSHFQCQSCNKIFKDKIDFKEHMRIHFRLLNAHGSD
jgi:uncharacterized C2H2 Zn-finger protein